MSGGSILDLNPDLEHLPLLGLWHSLLLLWAWPWPWPFFILDLQHELVIFSTAFMTLFAKSWAFLVWVCCTAFVACFTCATLCSMWTACSLQAAMAMTFLTISVGLDLVSCWCLGYFSIGLMSVEVFTVDLCSFAYWSRAVYVTSSHLFFDLTHFLTSKYFVAWNNNSVLCTSLSASEYWHLFMRSLICWSNWLVDSLSFCLISL